MCINCEERNHWPVLTSRFGHIEWMHKNAHPEASSGRLVCSGSLRHGSQEFMPRRFQMKNTGHSRTENSSLAFWMPKCNLEINSDFQCCNNRGVWDLKNLLWILRSEHFDIGKWILLDQSFISSYHWRNKKQIYEEFQCANHFFRSTNLLWPMLF